MKKRKNLPIEEEIWRQAKAEAAREGKTLAEWLEEAIKEKLPRIGEDYSL